MPLSLTTGFASQIRNIGRMNNSGWEADVNFKIVNKEDLHFSMGGNFSTNDNEVLEMAKDGNGETITITGTCLLYTSPSPRD